MHAKPLLPGAPDIDAASDQVGQAVSANLKRLRQQRAWTLDQLAERSHVSRTMLHQIEQGKSVPTIAVLWRIAAGLAVPFSQLVQTPGRPTNVHLPFQRSKILSNAQQTFASRALFPFDRGGASGAEFYELVIKPGGEERADPHAAGTTEQLVLVSGRAEVEVGEERYLLSPRDSLVFTADVPHAYRNLDPAQEALLYLVMTYRG